MISKVSLGVWERIAHPETALERGEQGSVLHFMGKGMRNTQ